MKTIAIIGAGPAGSNLARLIDTTKYNVILIDGSKKKGEKVCGGLLSPDAQDLLAKYDISLPKDVFGQLRRSRIHSQETGSRRN